MIAKKGFQIWIVQKKIHNIKEKKALFYMTLKENITVSCFKKQTGQDNP